MIGSNKRFKGLGFRVLGLCVPGRGFKVGAFRIYVGYRIWGLVWGSGFRGFGLRGLEFTDCFRFGVRFRVQGLGFRVWGLIEGGMRLFYASVDDCNS